MATKQKLRRYWVSANEQQVEALEKLMAEDMQTNVSAYFGFLIAEVTKMRGERKEKKPVGRPKKGEEEVVYYPSPDVKFGNRAPYTKEAWEAYWDIHEKWEPRPELPPPLTKEELKAWDM